MALAPTISICYHNCKTLQITDTTGLYNVDSNPGGWNAPNAAMSNVTKIEISINGTITNLTTLLPATVTGNFTMSLSDLGLADGFYDFIYTVYYSTGTPAVPTTVTYNLTEFITCSARCCIDKLVLRLSDNHCDCSDGELIDTITDAEAMLLSAQTSAAACGNRTQAINTLKTVQSICMFEECNCK